ncbi:type IV toxin-antitoxin system AbiEi family antitoxin domain-containing protein [Belliella sp. DSM 111904]|uniref:Type IV toxin-antitoxin system AbiEi family antitoxin domain-containing protein n=1 Tax=Belliella filtrata TaxID=2923435 RepID=A0ABS9V5R8_9BACT|nr:DUF6088 family protein [Belliella filtrata]MCH7411762.1 type IV toxin-antitoxin system AbiEi family antitoxin domain-containing protein [Belliella filtrata]
MESTEIKIIQQISSKPKGTLFFPEDFKSLGNREAIRVALHRMVKKGEIDRIAQGIYTMPKESKLLGKIYPSIDEVAQAIAKRDRARIMPTGSYAQYALGLMTQVPVNVVYLTDGAPRVVKIGNQTILFKRTSPKNLSNKSDTIALVIQGLKSIGKDNIEEAEIKKIVDILKREKKINLIHDKGLAPAWIEKIIDQSIKDQEYAK